MTVRFVPHTENETLRTLATLLLGTLLLAGCETQNFPWVRGSIEHGMPKLTEKFPSDAAFFVDKTEKRVKRAFEEALKARGFVVAENEEECDFVIKADVNSWEFNDAGFGGMGRDRDDMELSVSVTDRRKKRVKDRANISVRSDFRIIKKYVDEF